MSKSLSIESLSKKLRTVANTQDSIPMLALWIIHHKVNHEVIVNKWLDCVKEAKPSHRLTLFYLANDVIQNCSRKKAPIFKDSFGEVLPEAITYLRDDAILPNVERVLTVWSRRNVYDSEAIDDLHAVLLTNKAPDKLKQRLLAEYKPSTLIELISAFKKQEEQILLEEKQLRRSRIDVSSTDDIHKLKDKIGGEKFSRNFEESACHLEQFITEYEKYVEQRKQLVEALLQGSVFYSAQYHEAKIVVNAYKSFNNRVVKMKRLSDQVKLKLSASISPPSDAPSPENSPQQENEPADMDMSDSDQELGSKPSKIVAVDTNVLRPIPPQRFNNGNDLTQRIASLDTTRITDNSRSGIINRPGMRGASSSSSLLSSFQEAFTKQTSSPGVSKVSNKSTPIKKIPSASPSASPPSPTGSPELNIASPPRHQSLESRLADIFSQNPKGNDINENTGSESEAESIPPNKSVSDNEQKTTSMPGVSVSIGAISDSIISKLAAGTSSFSPEASGKDRNGDKNSFPSLSSDSPSWQNAIPVIGGMRNFDSSLLENLKSIIKKEEAGGSTPLQDESLDIGRTPGKMKKEFQIETITTSHTETLSEMALPPPSFSGDALNFLTKFMGGQTATKDLEPFSQWSDSRNGRTDSDYDTFPGLDVKRNNHTDEANRKLLEDSVWQEQPIRTTLDWAREKNGKVTKQDTDYRMQKNKNRENSKANSDIPSDEVLFDRDVHKSTLGILSPNLKPISISNIFNARHGSEKGVRRSNSDEKSQDSVDQFKDILRKKSSEQAPEFAPLSTEQRSFSLSQHANEDLIVEEEEIELDEDVNVNLSAGNDSDVHVKPTTGNSFQHILPKSNSHQEINDFEKSRLKDRAIPTSAIDNSKHLDNKTLLPQPPLDERIVHQAFPNDTYFNELENSFRHEEHSSHFDRRLPPNYPLPEEGFRRQPRHSGARPFPGPYERLRRPYGRRPHEVWNQEVARPAMRPRFPPPDNRPFGAFRERGGRGIRGARPMRFMPRNPYY